jgi:hypothetical protein
MKKEEKLVDRKFYDKPKQQFIRKGFFVACCAIAERRKQKLKVFWPNSRQEEKFRTSFCMQTAAVDILDQF